MQSSCSVSCILLFPTTFPFSFHLFLRTFQQPNPVCCNRSKTNLFMISFLSRTIDFFFFFLSLWIYLWLAETSQQPISQTTWLKVTPHCNHCNHCNKTPLVFISQQGVHSACPFFQGSLQGFIPGIANSKIYFFPP